MYNETPRVVVGNHAICRQDPDGENKSVWIEDIRTGEGAEFQDGLLAVVIEKFFDDNF
jgi:hypothetical protein